MATSTTTSIITARDGPQRKAVRYGPTTRANRSLLTPCGERATGMQRTRERRAPSPPLIRKIKHPKVADADKSKATELKDAHDSSKPPEAAAPDGPQGAEHVSPKVVEQASADGQGAEDLPPNVVAVEDPQLPKQGKGIARRKRLYLLIPGELFLSLRQSLAITKQTLRLAFLSLDMG
ncbi:hypothetical protein MTO96_022762 [Rhipicephalus appendiculatus]